MKTPLRISVWTVCLNATLNVLAVALLPMEWRHVGLAVSTVFCAACGCVFLAVAARRRNGPLGFSRLVAPVAKMVLCSSVMSAVVFAVKSSLDVPPVALLAVCLVTGTVVYFAVMAVISPAFFRENALIRRFARRRG